jgi:alcohol dehydrogenase class IV
MKNNLKYEYEELVKLESIIANKKSCFVVGNNSFTMSGFSIFLKNSKINNYIIHSDFSVNPKYDDIVNGVKIIQDFKPEIIIGIGGGSVLDTAKLISVFTNFDKSIKDVILGKEKITDRCIELCLIPTTAGSGSEATHFAVVYMENIKYSVASEYLLPDYVILDPILLESLPTKQASISAFDAFSQAIESIWSIHANDESLNFAFESLILLNNNIDQLILNPNKKCRKNILKASNLAGKAINITKTTAPHALSYFLTIKYKIPHGIAVFIILRLFVFYNSPTNLIKLKPFISNKDYLKRFNLILFAVNVNNEKELSKRILNLISLSNLTNYLQAFNLFTEYDIKLIANSVNQERLINNPMSLNESDIIKIFNKIN